MVWYGVLLLSWTPTSQRQNRELGEHAAEDVDLAGLVFTPCGCEVLHVCLKMSRAKHPM